MTSALRRRLRKVSTYAGGDCGTCGRDPNNLEWEWGGLEPLDSPEPAECPQCGTPDALGFEFKGQPDEDHRGGGMPEIRRCAGERDDGKPCERVIGATSTYCYSHDPEAAKTRKEASMIATAARGSTSARLKGLDKKLASLERDLREGLIDRGTAAVLNQILNTRARLVELNLRAIEQQEILDRLDEIEEYQARNKPMYRGASI